MNMYGICKLLIAAIRIFCCIDISKSQTDLTLQPGSSGVEVVNAVNDKIRFSRIFEDDKRLVIRAAYAATKFGLDNKTYREGYSGGIWQVNEDMYDSIKSSLTEDLARLIEQKLRINWGKSKWNDLEKPLFSGLAFRLFVRNEKNYYIDTIDRQAEYWRSYVSYSDTYWQQYMGYSDTAQDFIDSVSTLENENMCKRPMDLIIALECSSKNIYERGNSVVNLIYSLPLESVRIGLLLYGSGVDIAFSLGDDLSKIEMKSLVTSSVPCNIYDNLRTDSAINSAIKMFSIGNGNVPRVLVVFQEGTSTFKEKTAGCAKRAKQAGITTFSVAIGSSIEKDEILIIAGNNSNNVISSSSFDASAELSYRLQAKICTIPQKLEMNSTFVDFVAENETHYFSFKLPQRGIAIEISAIFGVTEAFYSFTFPTPSSACNDGVLMQSNFITNPNSGDQFQMDYDENSDNDMFLAIQGLGVANPFNVTINAIEIIALPKSTIEVDWLLNLLLSIIKFVGTKVLFNSIPVIEILDYVSDIYNFFYF